MLKKILIAAVAVVAGLIVVNKCTLLKVWWHDARNALERQVPPEVQLKQLKVEIDGIDKEIKKNLGRLAEQEVNVKMLAERVETMRTRQQKLRADIGDMQKGLEGRTERVVFNGHKYDSRDLTRKLDRTVTDFTNLKEQLKNNEQLLQDRKRTLEASHNRISEMRNQKEQLRTLSSKLETQLEIAKQKQMESRVVVDDSQISKAQELAHKIEVRLRQMEEEARLNRDYGYATPDSELTKDAKTTDEVLKSARKALQDETDPEAVVNQK